MMNIKKLKNLANKSYSIADAGQVTLKIEAGEKAETIVNQLQDYFGRNEDQQTVRLIFEDGKIGLLQRDDLYALANEGTRGIGDSDGSKLPGMPDVELIELCCKKEGCAQILLDIRYDSNDPTFCKLHPTTKMEPCNET